ncbi:hypothetical protein SAMN05444581_10264 [Methylocapsa palsarum]|uniref:Uncharacterized protein n=1 Tax=Methylocapsa palsarum TaxID=1612308 RepID=A0A1I3WTH2_9HYPH|nr:hypothetical protein SAMN05444581_10264 [Methylocapsa palsarum]
MGGPSSAGIGAKGEGGGGDGVCAGGAGDAPGAPILPLPRLAGRDGGGGWAV